MKFALAGNPNSGKTTLFNHLTGASAHVGNWPGVTVDKKEGIFKYNKEKHTLVDLPGIYSLSPYTPEEVVSRNFIINDRPDCIINIVDATNLERNLYLTTQILEMDTPVIIALNMVDVLKKNNISIDVKKLEKKIGVPVVEISALRGTNIDKLVEKAVQCASTPRARTNCLEKSIIAPLIKDTVKLLEEHEISDPLFRAVKLIENDEEEIKKFPKAYEQMLNKRNKIDNSKFNNDYEALIANDRYDFITSHYASCISRPNDEDETKSDKIDKVLTHRIWGIPLFLLGMLIIFHFVFGQDLFFMGKMGLRITNPTAINFFTGLGYEEGMVLEGIPSIGVFLQNWMGCGTDHIIDACRNGFQSIGQLETWYAGLICDGVLSGLAAIFSFLPQILLLFLVLAVLEDVGYMARVAFIMDKAFRKFGLSGKSFIPLLMGFGCSVPAMMATKTLDNEKERDLTIRVTPYFSCGAKAPIWAFLATCIAGSFLGDIFVFSIYLLGIVVAIVFLLFLKLFSKTEEDNEFIMELPAYHLPRFNNLMMNLWEKLKHFVYKAATIITAAIILVWFLSNFGWTFWKGLVPIEESMLAGIGKVLKYFFFPLGWTQGADGWKYSVAAIAGLIAKEDVVATLATLGITETAFTLNNAQTFAFAAYNLFTFPCFAAIATAKSESSKKGFLKTLLTWFTLSYGVSLIVYWIGVLFTNVLWAGILTLIGLILIICAIAYFIYRRRQVRLLNN